MLKNVCLEPSPVISNAVLVIFENISSLHLERHRTQNPRRYRIYFRVKSQCCIADEREELQCHEQINPQSFLTKEKYQS